MIRHPLEVCIKKNKSTLLGVALRELSNMPVEGAGRRHFAAGVDAWVHDVAGGSGHLYF